MFSFSGNRNQSSETDKCLLKPNFTFEDLLKCSDISNAYRSNNAKLLGYIINIDHMKEIYTLLMQTGDRQFHKNVLNLYQTSNMTLHRAFSDSVELVEFAFKSLDKNDAEHYSPYATGSLARYFSRAADPWPFEIHQVIKSSDILYKSILTNIDNLCIFCTINDLVQQISSNSYPLGELMWLLYLSISGHYSKHPPRICFLSQIANKIRPSPESDQPLFDPVKDKKKIIMSVELLKLYFRNNPKEKKLSDFKIIVNEFIVEIAQKEPERIIPEFFELARAAGYNETLQQLCITKLTELYQKDDIGNNLTAACLSYLCICASHITDEDCLKIIFSFVNEKVTQFTLLNIVELIKGVVKTAPSWLDKFADAISHFISYNWNKYREENQTILSILIEIAKSVPKLSITKEFDLVNKLWKCEEFIYNTDDKPAADTMTMDFSIPENLFDKNFVENINILKAEFPAEIPNFTKPPKDEDDMEKPEKVVETNNEEDRNEDDLMNSLMQSQRGSD